MDKVRKAMFSALRKSRKLQLPIDLQLQHFGMVVPILLYGSEVTGFENSEVLERLSTQFYKIILNVKKTTPNVMLFGELERILLIFCVKNQEWFDSGNRLLMVNKIKLLLSHTATQDFTFSASEKPFSFKMFVKYKR